MINRIHRPVSRNKLFAVLEVMKKGELIKWKDDLERELKENILPFWMKYSPDHINGGFVGHISYLNQVNEKADKGAVMHARILWTFAAVYRMFGDDAYLKIAGRAKDYIRDFFMDKEFGGVYWSLNYRGEPAVMRKQIYASAFVIYAFAEYFQAGGDKEALDSAIRLFREVEDHAFDSERNGYTEALSREWNPVGDVRLSDKDANERKTMNTHLHILEAYTNLFRVWKDTRLKQALENIITLFIEQFIDPGTWHLNLFFDDHWNNKTTFVSFGHDIECSWLLHEAAEVLGKKELADRTAEIAVKMARKNMMGLDSDNGLSYEFFPLENRLDSDRHWWVQAEALVGYFNAYQLSGDGEFLKKARGIWNFIREYLIDRNHGEWFWSVNREGIPNTLNEKAGFWKCPYHNSRACMEMIRRIEGYHRN